MESDKIIRSHAIAPTALSIELAPHPSEPKNLIETRISRRDRKILGTMAGSEPQQLPASNRIHVSPNRNAKQLGQQTTTTAST